MLKYFSSIKEEIYKRFNHNGCKKQEEAYLAPRSPAR